MRPEQKSITLLGVTRSKAKMIEYNVPEQYQEIDLSTNPSRLFTISIGLLGDLAAAINLDETNAGTHMELKNELLFSARFFDSFLQSKMNETLDPYLMILGSATYYLCDLPGSSSVLANRVNGDCPYLDGEGLEYLLLWLLKANLNTYIYNAEGPYSQYIYGISSNVLQFFKDGTCEESLLDLATNLREAVYEFGTPRQLLFGDVIGAVLRKKLENSTWKALPLYSGISSNNWLQTLQKASFIREFWPAQHLLGKADVLKGKSAIIQMPTSAGKTKATELILRSAFLANRINLAIIIAPFRALCHEIKNSLVDAFRDESTRVDELTDALQADFEIGDLVGHQQILVVTPEKLLYVLRHTPELASNIGLLVFDEGHQFDSGTRGITYELLLTSLRAMIPEETQKVLISAVISNAKAIGEWLNGEANIVEGTNLIPTFRSIGFVSWTFQLGMIEYVDSRNTDQHDFYVPRVIEKIKLGKKKRERVDRFFPEKSDSQAIALFLGLKLVSNGSVAIFCGRKDTASNISEKVVDLIERKVPLVMPREFSDQEEVIRLKYLHDMNLGEDAPASQSAAHGIFSHHGNSPHGIRLAIEYAMRENLVRFVVCTSTLAQGVNLPIRYLIVTSVYQGMDRIKVRDFHNLIGRAGRAGMHTEGSILFADPDIFDKRTDRDNRWRWNQVKDLLEPRNSEPCISNLLSIFEPIKSDDSKYMLTMEALDFVKTYINNPDEINNLANEIAEQHGDEGFSQGGMERQIAWRVNLINSVESFLLSHWDESDNGFSEADVLRLAEGTLAFFLADDQKKEHILELFKLLGKNISENITDSTQRQFYGRTLYGIRDAQAIEEWVNSNISQLLSSTNGNEILKLVWPLLVKHINNGTFKKFDKPDVLKEIAQEWLNGKSFCDLLELINKRNAKMIWGSRYREFKIDHIVDVCEGGLAYDGALLISALCEFIEMFDQDNTEELISLLQILQKRLKYGLPTETDIAIYEMGFSDRVIAQELSTHIWGRGPLRKLIRVKKADVEKVLLKYPSYFTNEVYNNLV
ncbi:MAG: DEAD/DEAH box helicase [Tissierellales bacterium]|nr:DEAD/DEAH box helicase [Tissierellales bacterium]